MFWDDLLGLKASLARIWRLLLEKIALPPRERSTWSAQTSIYVASGEPRSIAKRHYKLRLILMILQARKTRLARIWMRFYGPDKDFSHEKLGLVDFICKRRAGNTPSPPKWGPVGALATTTRTLSPCSNRENMRDPRTRSENRCTIKSGIQE